MANTFSTDKISILDENFGKYRIGFKGTNVNLCNTHSLFEPEINKHHAERIVRSWNEYDRLKEALQNMVNAYEKSRGLLMITYLHPEYSKAKELLNNLEKSENASNNNV